MGRVTALLGAMLAAAAAAVVLPAGPAAAEVRDNRQMVQIRGTMKITDGDFPDDDDIVNLSYAEAYMLTPENPHATFVQEGCADDEVGVTLTIDMSLLVNGSLRVDSSVQLREGSWANGGCHAGIKDSDATRFDLPLNRQRRLEYNLENRGLWANDYANVRFQLSHLVPCVAC